MTLAKNLRMAREAAGLSQAQLAEASSKIAGKTISQQYINNIEQGKSERPREIAAIALAVSIAPSTLMYGEVREDGKESDARMRDKGAVHAWEEESDLADDPERVWIDRFDYLFSAGNGTIQWEIREKHALPFNMSFFRAIGSKPGDCKLLVVRGDSMEPFLFHRDVFMVDLSQTQVMDGGIYAVLFEGESIVKQLFKEPSGSLRLHSYNPAYPDRIITALDREHFHVVGRCVYRSGAAPVI